MGPFGNLMGHIGNFMGQIKTPGVRFGTLYDKMEPRGVNRLWDKASYTTSEKSHYLIIYLPNYEH